MLFLFNDNVDFIDVIVEPCRTRVWRPEACNIALKPVKRAIRAGCAIGLRVLLKGNLLVQFRDVGVEPSRTSIATGHSTYHFIEGIVRSRLGRPCTNRGRRQGNKRCCGSDRDRN